MFPAIFIKMAVTRCLFPAQIVGKLAVSEIYSGSHGSVAICVIATFWPCNIWIIGVKARRTEHYENVVCNRPSWCHSSRSIS